MKLMILFFLSLLTLNAHASTSAENFRCWADPGYDGVIKIDIAEKLMCVTGLDGQNYDCNDKAFEVVKLESVKDSTVVLFGETVQAKTFHAQSTDKTKDAVLTVYLQDYPRPYFPKFNVTLADLSMNTGFWPYPYKWSAKPTGEITDGQLYCMSERYFIK